MEKNNVVVTGAFGQDGSIMCKKLIDLGYNVYGIVKDIHKPKNKVDSVFYVSLNLEDINSLEIFLKKIKPKKIYNFLGVSNVFNPWENPKHTYVSNFLIPLNFLEIIKKDLPSCKFLNASSSLIFGNSKTKIQNEKTTPKPIFHYGYSKNFIGEIIKTYRKTFGLFLCSAIFYNHESEFREDSFFTKKVIKGSLDIINGKKEKLVLGDLDVYRDIGYAHDYMDACIKIMDNNFADDYIISSGNKIKMLDFVKIVFDKLNLSIEHHLEIDKKLIRKQKITNLYGDNTKIKSLGWYPKTDVINLIDKMIEYEKKIIK